MVNIEDWRLYGLAGVIMQEWNNPIESGPIPASDEAYDVIVVGGGCLLYTSPSPRDRG